MRQVVEEEKWNGMKLYVVNEGKDSSPHLRNMAMAGNFKLPLFFFFSFEKYDYIEILLQKFGKRT